MEALAERLKPGDGAAAAARREIDLIREYRTRLVADVATGQVDVRGVTRPELPATGESIDDGIDEEEAMSEVEGELAEEAADAEA